MIPGGLWGDAPWAGVVMGLRWLLGLAWLWGLGRPVAVFCDGGVCPAWPAHPGLSALVDGLCAEGEPPEMLPFVPLDVPDAMSVRAHEGSRLKLQRFIAVQDLFDHGRRGSCNAH